MAIAVLTAIGIFYAVVMRESPFQNSSANAQNDPVTSASDIHFQQGTIASVSDPLPGHSMHQLAMILPPRTYGQVYSGVLTFVATKKVEVVALHEMTNKTDIPSKYGKPHNALVPPDDKTRVAISLIIPDYGTTHAMSFSIPFAGNALALHTLSGEPFATTCTVSYHLRKPTLVNNIGQ